MIYSPGIDLKKKKKLNILYSLSSTKIFVTIFLLNNNSCICVQIHVFIVTSIAILVQKTKTWSGGRT